MENQLENQKSTTNEVEKKKRQPRKKGCTQCKKKKEIVSLEMLQDLRPIMWPTNDEIKLAYHELTNMKGVQENKKPFITFVYETIFQEKFDWSCNSCAHTQARKFEAYCNKNKIKL
jgi:hypothetical protein